MYNKNVLKVEIFYWGRMNKPCPETPAVNKFKLL